MAAYWSPSVSISGSDGEPEKVLAATCSNELFGVLGVSPRLGRGIQPDDDVPGARRVAVLGHGLWQRRFGGHPQAVGRELMLDGVPTLIVGVMPAGFEFPVARNGAVGAAAIVAHATSESGDSPGRLPRVPHPERRRAAPARRHARAIAIRADRRWRPSSNAHTRTANREMGLTVVPLQDTVVGRIRPALLVLLGAVTCVLLIACANVGSLLLVRAAGRAREVTIRMALGADRARLVRQMLTESVVLAVAGGAAGLVVSAWMLDVLLRLAPAGIPRLETVRLDGSAVAFTFLIALACGLLFGVAPAFQVRARSSAGRAGGVRSRPRVGLASAGPSVPRGRGDRALDDAARRRGAADSELRASAARGCRLPRLVGPGRRSDRAAARPVIGRGEHGVLRGAARQAAGDSRRRVGGR